MNTNVFLRTDAPREIPFIGEFANATTTSAIAVLQAGRTNAAKINARRREVNTDGRSQFFTNKKSGKNRGQSGSSDFQESLTTKETEHLLPRRKDPQANGRIERRFQECIKDSDRLASAQEFADRYNKRRYGASWLEHGGAPNEAYQKPECLI